mmetsp:Transcript_96807/g.273559  ORF Transcript_96807/g.273559 Transcript_96807/m.273559 type:complete len:380 (+) Transcript_96807:282-1421(+)
MHRTHPLASQDLLTGKHTHHPLLVDRFHGIEHRPMQDARPRRGTPLRLLEELLRCPLEDGHAHVPSGERAPRLAVTIQFAHRCDASRLYLARVAHEQGPHLGGEYAHQGRASPRHPEMVVSDEAYVQASLWYVPCPFAEKSHFAGALPHHFAAPASGRDPTIEGAPRLAALGETSIVAAWVKDGHGTDCSPIQPVPLCAENCRRPGDGIQATQAPNADAIGIDPPTAKAGDDFIAEPIAERCPTSPLAFGTHAMVEQSARVCDGQYEVCVAQPQARMRAQSAKARGTQILRSLFAIGPPRHDVSCDEIRFNAQRHPFWQRAPDPKGMHLPGFVCSASQRFHANGRVRGTRTGFTKLLERGVFCGLIRGLIHGFLLKGND